MAALALDDTLALALAELLALDVGRTIIDVPTNNINSSLMDPRSTSKIGLNDPTLKASSHSTFNNSRLLNFHLF